MSRLRALDWISGGNIGVAEEILRGPNVGSPLQQMGRETVARGVTVPALVRRCGDQDAASATDNRDRVSLAAEKFPPDDDRAGEYVAIVGAFSKTTANLLRKLPLTETSLIVHWCSEDHGLIKTVAKGARRLKSPFAGRLDLFFQCEIEIVPSRRGDLHILKELAVRKNRLGIRKTYLRTLAASYFVRLIERVAESETPIPELSDLLDRALDYLDGAEVDGKAVRFFEKETARFLGLGEGAKEPCRLIADTFGDLPDLRKELMARLGRPPA